jgi:hypothetical protein
LVHRGDFDQSRHVAPRSHGNRHVRHLKPKNFVKCTIKANPIDRLHFLPILERGDQIEALLDPDTANAENRRHVNDANPANFHVIARQFRRRRHELAPLQRSDPRHVVGYEAIAALDQPKDAFALANAARAANQNADAEDIHHATELGHGRREIDFQRDRRSINELHRDHWRAKHRNLCFPGDSQQLRREVKPARHHQARDLALT